jgi:hypothetical protein
MDLIGTLRLVTTTLTPPPGEDKEIVKSQEVSTVG